MKDWLRRADPAFYAKEPNLLRTRAQIGRYTDDAQVQARLSVLVEDRTLHVATALVLLAAYAVATGGAALDPRSEWPALWAFAVLAAGVPRALPWWPQRDAVATWGPAAVATALIAVSASWPRVDPVLFAVALLAGATLYGTREASRATLVLAFAVGVLFGMRVPAHPIVGTALAGALAAGAAVLTFRALGPAWRAHPQIATWSALAALVAVCTYGVIFDAAVIAPRMPVEIAALAVAYAGVCVIAGRIRRAELSARPGGVLTLPQSIVPLLDRSHDHAIICRLE